MARLSAFPALHWVHYQRLKCKNHLPPVVLKSWKFGVQIHNTSTRKINSTCHYNQNAQRALIGEWNRGAGIVVAATALRHRVRVSQYHEGGAAMFILGVGN